uniref:Uncharacterized protein n=1 Tax=Arundo donax TaxID=35708 RepID=A0A0A9A202_ARUDO
MSLPTSTAIVPALSFPGWLYSRLSEVQFKRVRKSRVKTSRALTYSRHPSGLLGVMGCQPLFSFP